MHQRTRRDAPITSPMVPSMTRALSSSTPTPMRTGHPIEAHPPSSVFDDLFEHGRGRADLPHVVRPDLVELGRKVAQRFADLERRVRNHGDWPNARIVVVRSLRKEMDGCVVVRGTRHGAGAELTPSAWRVKQPSNTVVEPIPGPTADGLDVSKIASCRRSWFPPRVAELRSIDPGSFRLEGQGTGIVLCHGFCGSPAEMRPVAEVFNRAGFAVSAPLLPGHGTSPRDLARVGWVDWHAALEAAIADIRTRCDRLLVAGLSVGALLALYTAARNPTISGVAAFAPVGTYPWLDRLQVRILRRLCFAYENEGVRFCDPAAKKKIWHYDVFPLRAIEEVFALRDATIAILPRLRGAVFIASSPVDEICKADDVSRVASRLHSSVAVRHREFANSGHCMTADAQAQEVASAAIEFLSEAT